ncbi:MAG TPA: hypothetical protein VF331_22395, partial [Polyangiales bacterium]
ARGLQVESGLGVLYGAARAITGHPEATSTSYGSDNFTGTVADWLAAGCTPLSVLLLGALALGVWRTRRATATSETLAALVACVLCVLWLSGKVLSPQYFTWALPVAVVLPWARERVLLLALLAVSQLYLRVYFDDVLEQTTLGVSTLLLRQTLLALFAWCCWRRWSAATP